MFSIACTETVIVKNTKKKKAYKVAIHNFEQEITFIKLKKRILSKRQKKKNYFNDYLKI